MQSSGLSLVESSRDTGNADASVIYCQVRPKAGNASASHQNRRCPPAQPEESQPRDSAGRSLVVITGLSGSGKSSTRLRYAFAEGQRKYVRKPFGVCPAIHRSDGRSRRSITSRGFPRPIAIEQRSSTASPPLDHRHHKTRFYDICGSCSGDWPAHDPGDRRAGFSSSPRSRSSIKSWLIRRRRGS